MDILLQVLLLAVGFVMLTKGADWFVDGAAGIADKFGIPQLVIGLTIVAMGTSAPEAAVSISAALKGSAAITVGNVVGSNILNILIILGLTAVLAKEAVKVADSTIKYEMPFMIVITVIFLLLGLGGYLRLSDGLIMWALFLLYLGYMLRMARKDKTAGVEEAEDGKKKTVLQLVLLTGVGLALIIFGSKFTVDAATEIARAIGVSERFIGLTVIALGTSLPELFTSVTAARKGDCDIAIGNIVGSNIFNILFVAGTSALITPVVFESKFIVDTLVAAGSGILLWLLCFRKKSLNKPAGVIMLACYAAYFVYLVLA